MPSDKIVLSTPSFITPEANSTPKEAAELFLSSFLTYRPEKRKKAIKENSSTAFFEVIYCFMDFPAIPVHCVSLSLVSSPYAHAPPMAINTLPR
jgi:hypothetical protein